MQIASSRLSRCNFAVFRGPLSFVSASACLCASVPRAPQSSSNKRKDRSYYDKEGPRLDKRDLAKVLTRSIRDIGANVTRNVWILHYSLQGTQGKRQARLQENACERAWSDGAHVIHTTTSRRYIAKCILTL
jgi:hypothetical protein